MEKIHPLLIKNSTYLFVKFLSEKKVDYTYLAVAKSGVDEDGDVRVMFYKTVGDAGKLFKLVETDISDMIFENLLKIGPTTKEVKRGRCVYYEFDQPIEVIEKWIRLKRDDSTDLILTKDWFYKQIRLKMDGHLTIQNQ